MYGFIDLHTIREKHKLDISVSTMQSILDEMIEKERDRIDKLIDMEIERKVSNGEK